MRKKARESGLFCFGRSNVPNIPKPYPASDTNARFL